MEISLEVLQKLKIELPYAHAILSWVDMWRSVSQHIIELLVHARLSQQSWCPMTD
jgi:hypothetical protein